MITTLRVSGMTCNGCVTHVEAALRKVPGVTAVQVNLATGQAQIDHQATVSALIAAVKDAGYEANDFALASP